MAATIEYLGGLLALQSNQHLLRILNLIRNVSLSLLLILIYYIFFSV